jgi:DNA polymerase-3 subunit beta
MKFTLNKAQLLKELNLIQGVVEKKNTIPILSNVLIDVKGPTSLTLVATDLDISFQTQCEADVSQPGSVILQARKLFDIIRNLPDAEILFTREENDWVRIICGSSEFRVVGQSREHFPSPPVSNEPGVLLPSAILHDLIARTIYAITQEESRYALNGSLFKLSGQVVQMVATDGHRLSLAEARMEGSSGTEILEVNIPKKALTELMKLTAGTDEAVEFSRDENHLFFRMSQRQLTSRMLSGQFPNYDLVLPKNNDKAIPLNRERITQAIRRVALMADERSHGIKFDLSSGKVNVTSQSADFGEARETLAVEYQGDSLSIGFNAQYLMDFLGVVGTNEIVVELKDEQSPALIRPVGEEKYDYRYVVMPMRLL